MADPFDVLGSAWRDKPGEAQHLRQYLGKQYQKKYREAAKKRLEEIPGTKEQKAAAETAKMHKQFFQLAELEDFAAKAEPYAFQKFQMSRTKPTKRSHSSRKVKMNTPPGSDPALKMSVVNDTPTAPIPENWVALVLYVVQEADPNGRIYENKPFPYYKIWARRLKPAGQTGEETTEDAAANTDSALANPCIIDKSHPMYGSHKKNWVAIMAHPTYTNVDPSLRMPSPGDLITVSMKSGTVDRKGLYIGFGASRPLPEKIKYFRTPQSTKAKLAKDYPMKTPEEPKPFEAVRYPPFSEKAYKLFEQAAAAAGHPKKWARSPGLHKLLKAESGGWVGVPNRTYTGRTLGNKSKWPEVWGELKKGEITAESSATGLGQLLLRNVDKYYPRKRMSIGNAEEEARGMLNYIKARYGNPTVAWEGDGETDPGYGKRPLRPDKTYAY